MAKSKAKRPPKNYDDNPVWTAKDFKRARPLSQVDPGLAAAIKRGPGRPTHGDKPKVPVSLRLPPDILDAYKATGDGWQGRMTDALTQGAKKLPRSRRAA